MRKRSIIFILNILIIIIILFVIKSHDNSVMYPNKALEVGDGNIVISCVGDSITYGYGLSNRNDSWVSLLPSKLGDKYKTINYGLIKRTLLSSGDYPYFNESLAKEFLENDTDKIIFMLGSNDSKKINWNKALFYEEYEDVINRLIKKVGRNNLYIMIPPKIFINNPKSDDANNDNLLEIKEIINEIGSSNGVRVIDLYSLSEEHSDWYIDGLHLNKTGNKEVAEEISKIIKE